MTFFKKKILQIITVAFFSFALLLPTAVKFAHTLEGHEHLACTDFSVHLHKKQLDCSICDFHYSIFDFKPQEIPDFVVFHSFQHIDTVYLIPGFNLNPKHYFLRGPPLFS
jgi:hypothetical protein